jgi:hypothetical protein
VILDDSGKKDETPPEDVYGAIATAASAKEEHELQDAFESLVDMQHELEEDVKFTQAAKGTVAVKDGSGEDGLWQTVRLWQRFVDHSDSWHVRMNFKATSKSSFMISDDSKSQKPESKSSAFFDEPDAFQ